MASSKRFLTVALFTILIVVLVNLVWWLFYDRIEDLLEQQLSRRLRSVASSVATGINPSQLELIALGDIETYAEISARLEQARAVDSLSELFVLDTDFQYLATTLLEHDPEYFLTTLNGPQIDSLFLGYVDYATISPTYFSGPIRLKSAFAPIVDSTGQVIAVVGVEANVDYFDSLADLRRQLWTASGLSIAGGLVLGILFLILQRAITRTEQQLYLAQTQTWLGRMVAVVAHEVRNPLQIVRASAERLKKKHAAVEADFIIEETDRLNAIVTGYLNVAKAEGPLLSGEPVESFDLVELLHGLIRNTQEKFLPSTVTWFQSPDIPAVQVNGFKRSLRQVLLNLLANGAEACLSANRPIELGLQILANHSGVTIRVSDHGDGFTRSEQKQLFTPFFTTKSKGSGLGLYLSQKIIAEMGGTLKIAESGPGGTTMEIELPTEVKAQ
uniref:histidine kinase n=1 Tax=uncultured bacterium pAW1 TaxID=1781155 RepID=A0A1C9U4P6_9BACT|nr:hypothetical protein [uncultured bacterium pAW1]